MECEWNMNGIDCMYIYIRILYIKKGYILLEYTVDVSNVY